MAPRGKQSTVEMRHLIIRLYGEGKTVRNIAEIVGRSRSTVHDVIKRYRNENRVENKSKIGLGKILNDHDERRILLEVKKNPLKSAVELQKYVETHIGKSVCCETVRNTLRKHDFHGRVLRKKPFISPKNKTVRLKFAKEYILKNQDFWNKVLYTDESKFNLHGSDGRRFVWRKPNIEFEVENTKATVKHGGGSVMVWRCMSSAGVGNLVFIDGKMDRHVYLNILKNNVKQSAEKLGIQENFAFYQDNDPKYTAEVCKLWLIHHCPKLLKHPPQLPDLNVIEHLWDELARKVYKSTFNNISQLKIALKTEGDKIPAEVCANLVNSMQKRLQKVIDSKGNATKY